MGNTNDRNAGSVVAGFVYQIYYFLYRLLTMGVDETVSLEKFEDVGVETGNERTYYQRRHYILSLLLKISNLNDFIS